MPDSPSLAAHPGLDEWISIGKDGRILLRTGKVDIGQRVSTALAMIVAEELDVDPERIDVTRTRTGRDPNEGVTASSVSMEDSGNAARAAAATARRQMLSCAAAELDVDAASLEVEDGTIRSRDTNRTLTYQEVQGGSRFDVAVDPAAPVKAAEEHRVVGTAAIPQSMRDIVTGRYEFLHDTSLPGMVHARVVRPPHYHARLVGLDPALPSRLAARQVTLIREGSFLAVAGPDEYATQRAGDQVFAAAEWDLGEGLEPQDTRERLTSNERERRLVVNGTPVNGPIPDPAEPSENAAVTLEARYDKPYHMHGSIGPSAAIAVWRDDGISIISHTQGVYLLRGALAETLDMDPERIEITHAPGAGCYGHNGADDVVLDAVLVARAMPGVPVLLKWTREQEHAWEPYGSCMALQLRASLDGDGTVIDWSHESYSDTFNMRPRAGPGKAGAARLLASQYLDNPPPRYIPVPAMVNHMGIHRNLDPIYNFSNRRLVKNLVRNLPLRVSALRTLGALGNVFAIECFMDELAAAAGLDPVDFRLRHLDDSRARDTLEAVAHCLDQWPETEGRGRGIGFARYKNRQAYTAVGMEIEVNDAAEIRLHRTAIAVDAGEIVDRAGLTAQMEGGMLQAASWTLYEEVTFDRGGITSRDWDDYPILRFDNIPEIQTILIDRPGEPFLGAGETSSGPAAAAIGNAVFAATGLRIRQLPMTPDTIRATAFAS